MCKKNQRFPLHVLYMPEVWFYTAVLVMPIGAFDVLQGPDPLDILVGRHEQHHTPSNYARLFELARLDTTWRSVVRTNVETPLLAKTKQTMLDIALLYETANTFATPLHMHNYLQAIVRALLFFQKLKDDIMHLDLVTALHTACCSAGYVSEPWLIEEITTAGGVEAVIGTMVMNTSSLPLDIACIRMLAKLRQYRKVDDDTWGWWTTRQSKTAVRVILEAMRKFPLSLDLQCCGISCLALLCSEIDGPPGEGQYHICRHYFQVLGGVHLAVGVMHANNHATLHVHICQLLLPFVKHVSWEETKATNGTNVLYMALRHSIAPGTDLESTMPLLQVISEFNDKCGPYATGMHKDLQAMSLLFEVLQRMLVHNDTHTLAQVVEKHNILFATVELLSNLIVNSSKAKRNFVLVPHSFEVLVQILSASQDLVCTIPPALHLQHQPQITRTSCLKIQLWICQCLVLVGNHQDISEYLFHAGALAVLFHIFTHTINRDVRSAAIQAAKPISIKDTAQKLRILHAGGLQVLADMFRRLKLTDYHTCLHSFWFLQGLAKIPVYARAMHDMGFVQIMKDLSWYRLNTDVFVALLEAAAANPVDV